MMTMDESNETQAASEDTNPGETAAPVEAEAAPAPEVAPETPVEDPSEPVAVEPVQARGYTLQ